MCACPSKRFKTKSSALVVNLLNAELNLICYLLALLDHHFLHVSRIRVKSLTLRPLMSYILERLFLMFLDHTQRRTTVGRTPLDEWSARRRDLYLTTHDTRNRQISIILVQLLPSNMVCSGLVLWPIPEAAVTVFSAPDDGCCDARNM